MYPMVTINNEEKYIIKYEDFYRFSACSLKLHYIHEYLNISWIYKFFIKKIQKQRQQRQRDHLRLWRSDITASTLKRCFIYSVHFGKTIITLILGNWEQTSLVRKKSK